MRKMIKRSRPLSLIFSRKLSEAANENWFEIGMGQNVLDCTVFKMYEEHLATICGWSSCVRKITHKHPATLLKNKLLHNIFKNFTYFLKNVLGIFWYFNSKGGRFCWGSFRYWNKFSITWSPGLFNPLQHGVAFPYPLKTSGNLKVSWCFEGI